MSFQYNSKAAQETLMDLTRDSDPNVRATAAVTLAKITDPGNKKVSDRLEKESLFTSYSIYQECGTAYCSYFFRLGLLLKDKDRLVRESACVALGL